MEELPKNYDPKEIEGPLFEEWEKAGYFLRGSNGAGVAATARDDDPYTIVIPPPNVTGVLHMGHALNGTIQDVLVRHARMQGKKTRWIVGTDHAGIATQNRVEKRLAQRGLTRFDVGREQFVEECWKWREEYGNTIIHQFRSIGCSCDYSDEKFTMGPAYQKAIRHVFVDWYHRGLIYRGNRIINWCPRCSTALSDAEVEHEEKPEAGHLWYLRYPLKEPVNGREYLIVATTRPETMLGDTAVAVNPKDERYSALVGATVMLPIADREIPVIADDYVDMAFGTGCVKITPAHDPNDFEVGLRHNLPQINVMNPDASINEEGKQFEGMDRYAARDAIVAWFDEHGLLDHVEDHENNPGHCYRCDTVVEPWLSDQWFVKMEPLAKPAIEAVKDGRIKQTPKRWDSTYFAWLENIRDWCISRQLWWGHRIPVFYCDECGWEDALEEDIDVCPKCGAKVRQDEDVLDTWFSSQLWPFATMGWLEDGPASDELRKYYPTQVLSTAPDILFLWVARMVMSSLDFMHEVPFQDVIYHPTVLDKHGDRMSKSKGNGIDPLDLIEQYGADAMRFHLAARVTGAQSFKLDPDMIAVDRNFITKIWNASRFVLMNLEGYKPGPPIAEEPADRWILSRLAKLVKDVNAGFESYSFNEIAHDLYSFFWSEFCDWYIEFTKSRLAQDEGEGRLAAQRDLVFVLDTALRLLHPFMPFVTETIWQKLPTGDDSPSIMVSRWPEDALYSKFIDEDAEKAVGLGMEVVVAVRAARARYQISPKQQLGVIVKASGEDAIGLERTRELTADLAHLKSLSIDGAASRPDGSVATLAAGLEVYIDLEGLVDFDAERARFAKELKSAQAELAKVQKKLGNPGYLAKAAPEIIDKDRSKAEDLESTLKLLKVQLDSIS